MAQIVIQDLEKCIELDRAALCKIRGGSAYSQYLAAQRRRRRMMRYRKYQKGNMKAATLHGIRRPRGVDL